MHLTLPCPSPPSALQLLIDGNFVAPAAGRTFEVVDPRNEQTILNMAEGDKQDVEK